MEKHRTRRIGAFLTLASLVLPRTFAQDPFEELHEAKELTDSLKETIDNYRGQGEIGRIMWNASQASIFQSMFRPGEKVGGWVEYNEKGWIELIRPFPVATIHDTKTVAAEDLEFGDLDMEPRRQLPWMFTGTGGDSDREYIKPDSDPKYEVTKTVSTAAEHTPQVLAHEERDRASALPEVLNKTLSADERERAWFRRWEQAELEMNGPTQAKFMFDLMERAHDDMPGLSKGLFMVDDPRQERVIVMFEDEALRAQYELCMQAVTDLASTLLSARTPEEGVKILELYRASMDAERAAMRAKLIEQKTARLSELAKQDWADQSAINYVVERRGTWKAESIPLHIPPPIDEDPEVTEYRSKSQKYQNTCAKLNGDYEQAMAQYRLKVGEWNQHIAQLISEQRARQAAEAADTLSPEEERRRERQVDREMERAERETEQAHKSNMPTSVPLPSENPWSGN